MLTRLKDPLEASGSSAEPLMEHSVVNDGEVPSWPCQPSCDARALALAASGCPWQPRWRGLGAEFLRCCAHLCGTRQTLFEPGIGGFAMALRHAGARFPYRHPPGSGGALDKLSGVVGSALRAVGAALDEFGCILQGPSGVKETGVAPPALSAQHLTVSMATSNPMMIPPACSGPQPGVRPHTAFAGRATQPRPGDKPDVKAQDRTGHGTRHRATQSSGCLHCAQRQCHGRRQHRCQVIHLVSMQLTG